MKKVVLVFVLTLTCLLSKADTFVWVGTADAVDSIVGPGGRFHVFQNWFNQTTGLPATNAPSYSDDVIINLELFDSNPAGIISILFNYTINSLTISDATPASTGGNIRIASSAFLYINGDLNIPSRPVSITTVSAGAPAIIQFSGSANRILRTSGTVFTNINFIFSMNSLAVNGGITFMDNFENTGNPNTSFAINAGNINTNGFGIKTTALVFSGTMPNTPTINLNNSTIEATVITVTNNNNNLTTAGTNLICTNGGTINLGTVAATTIAINNVTLTNNARLFHNTLSGTLTVNQVNCQSSASLRRTNSAAQFNNLIL